MKHEIITLENVPIIGMAKEIAFCKGQEECPKFWGEYVERIIKPVFMEHKAPDAFQQAAIDNGVGEFGLCTCDIPNHNCATCWEANFGACSKNTFTYVIGGIYKGGGVPEGMKLFPIHSGKWLKMHFEGGMKAFQEQYQMFYKEWLPQHSEFHCPNNAMTMEWYNGTDIDSSNYQCGVMMPLENLTNKDIMDQKFCQSCGMPLTEDVLGTNADGSKNEDYCMYCYKDGLFLQDCTMEEMIEHCAQFFAEQSGKAERVDAVNEGLDKPITKEEYIGMMKTYFPQLKRWRKTLNVSNDEVANVNPALAGVKELIAQMADKLPIAYISSVDQEGFPWTKAMLKPRKREGIRTFYFTTNTFSIRVAQYKANPKASIYFCDAKGFKGMMLRGTMEVLTDAASKEMIWHNGDEQYYPGGVTDPNYCVLKFTATDGRFYSDFYPRSFVIE